MKTLSKLLLFALIFTLIACSLLSCGEAKPPKEEKQQKVDITGFSICFASSLGARTSNAVTALQKKINSAYGIQIVMNDDFLLPGDTAPVGTREILIGKTTREQSSAALPDDANYLDYAVSYDGEKIVVVGSSDEATANAVRFLSSLIEKDGLYMNVGYEYTYRHSYPCVDTKINGIPLAEYTIAYAPSDISRESASHILKELSAASGHTLAVDKMSNVSEKAIFVGSAEELGVSFVSEECGYGIAVDGGNVYLAYTTPKSAVRLGEDTQELFSADMSDGHELVKTDETVRIVMLGDSNTAGAKVHQWFETYMTSRHPDVSYKIINSGIGGDTPSSGLERIQWDVLERNPDVVIVNFGCNGVLEQFGSLTGKINESERASKLKWFVSGMESIVKELLKNNVEVVLATPIAYDEWVSSTEESYLNAYIGFEMMRDEVKALAEKYTLECVDYYSNISAIIKDYREQSGDMTVKTVYSDRKHVDLAGALAAALAYAEDHTVWGESVVASVDLTAKSNEVKTEKADVSVYTSDSDYICYSYRPHAVPLPENEYYTKLEKYGILPLSDYNKEIIRVQGLDEGEYEIYFDGALVAKATAGELSAGVNIADSQKNPSQKAAKLLFDQLLKKTNNTSIVRSFFYIETRYIIPKGLASLTVEQRVENFKQALEKKTVSGYLSSCMNSYIEKSSSLDKYEKENDYAEYKSLRLAITDPYTVEIVKVN